MTQQTSTLNTELKTAEKRRRMKEYIQEFEYYIFSQGAYNNFSEFHRTLLPHLSKQGKELLIREHIKNYATELMDKPLDSVPIPYKHYMHELYEELDTYTVSLSGLTLVNIADEDIDSAIITLLQDVTAENVAELLKEKDYEEALKKLKNLATFELKNRDELEVIIRREGLTLTVTPEAV